MRRLAAFLLAAGLAAGASPAQAQPARHAFTQAHVLRYATSGDISTLNPHFDAQLVLSYMSSLTMAYLLKTGPRAESVPELATAVPTLANGGVSRDGLTITYHLRRDAKWSDGVPFDADDVAFTIKTILDPKVNELSRDGWELIARVDEPDKYTVVLHLKKKYSPYAVTFFSTAGPNPCILPKHLLAHVASVNDAPYNALPVGIGPFKYERWDRGNEVVAVANPAYFRGRPKLDRIVYKIVPDRNTVLTQLTTHEIDLWLPITAPYYDRVRAIGDVTVVKQPAYTFDHIDFNLTRPIFADARVRQALRFATNREIVRQKVRHGLGTVSDNVFGSNHPSYHPIARTPFDLAQANRLLDAAGWRRGGDGIRTKGGLRLALDFATVAGASDTDQMIELIRPDWKAVGADISIRHYPSSLMFALQSQGGIMNGGKFDVLAAAWSLDNFGQLSELYGCDAFPPAGQNDTHWCNRPADAAMNAFLLEYDPAKRKRFDDVATDALARDVPFIVMDIRDNIFGYNSDLRNWHPNPVAPFDDMMNVDI